MEVNMHKSKYEREKIDGKNQYYYTYNKETNTWNVMKRHKTVGDKILKKYKTELGARNCAFHKNLY